MVMRIRKGLGTNAALVVDDAGTEHVATGKGIAFGKSAGDAVDASAVEKVFRSSPAILNPEFHDLLSSLPIEEIRAVQEIVSMARAEVGREISDALYVSLADHIHNSLELLAQGIAVPNSLQLDVMCYYPGEFAAGRRALDIIRDETGASLPIDEAGYIALHIVSAEMGDAVDGGQGAQASAIIHDALQVIREAAGRDPEADPAAHRRLITHLRFFAQRLLSDDGRDGEAGDRDLARLIAERYPEAHRCALAVRDRMRERYETEVGEDELMYLTIHIERSIDRKGQPR